MFSWLSIRRYRYRFRNRYRSFSIAMAITIMIRPTDDDIWIPFSWLEIIDNRSFSIAIAIAITITILWWVLCILWAARYGNLVYW